MRKNLLVLAITLALLLAWQWPQGGLWLKTMTVSSPLIMLIFFFQGFAVESRDLRQIGMYLPLVLWGAIVAHGLGPLAGSAGALVFQLDGDSRVGLIMMSCMAPTLVSGVVIAAQGGGNRTSAMILTIVLNLLAVLLIPLNLRWTLGGSVAIDQWELLRKLLLLILVPAVIGHVFSAWRPALRQRHASAITQLPVYFLGLLVYISISEQVDHLSGIGWRNALVLLVAALSVHFVLLIIAYGVSRWPLKAEIPHARSLSIVCSQKTIPVAVAVWTMAFKAEYPLAIVPAIVFHLGQIYADGFLARWWVRDHSS